MIAASVMAVFLAGTATAETLKVAVAQRGFWNAIAAFAKGMPVKMARA
jgi:hypothetical protein